MLKIGLTGNIGSGKSTVAKVFSTLGVPVFHADEESKKLLHDHGIKTLISRIFGSEILTESGEIDRKRLAKLVFTDPAGLRSLNSLLHPIVLRNFDTWCSRFNDHPYVIQEAAIILEGGYKPLFDRIIHVSCSLDTAVERVIKRDHTERTEVLMRMQNQFEDSIKAGMSHFVIRNDGSVMVLPQILSIHNALLALHG